MGYHCLSLFAAFRYSFIMLFDFRYSSFWFLINHYLIRAKVVFFKNFVFSKTTNASFIRSLLIRLLRPDEMSLTLLNDRSCSFMSCQTDYHLTLAKHLLRYLKHTIGYAIYYSYRASEIELELNCDADFSNDIPTGN